MSWLFGNKTAKQGAVALDVNSGLIVTGEVHGDVNLFQGIKLQPLDIPWRNREVRANVDALLHWQSDLTALIDRKAELEKLHGWANSSFPMAVLTLTGEGGVGKTRLAFHFARQLQGEDWEAGQWSNPEKPAAFRLGERGTLLIVDYVEEKHIAVDKLLDALKRMKEPENPLRILFLSRNPGYSQTISDRVGILADDPIALTSFQDVDDYGWQLFTAAWKRMRQIKELPEQPPPLEKAGYLEWQGKHRLHTYPLFILAYALNLIEEPRATTLNGPEVIERLVSQERDRMRLQSQAYRLHPQALELPKALAAITGGLKARQLDALSQLPEFAGILPSHDQLLQHGLWVSGSDGKDGLPALQPDILAACLLSQVLARGDDKPGQWQYDVLAIADDPADACSRLGRLIHDATVTLKLPWPMDDLVEAVKDDEARCGTLDQGLSRPALERPLLPLAIAVSETLAKHAEHPAEQARNLNNLSLRLAESGDRAGGLEAIRRSVEIYEQLAEGNFAAYGPDLAMSLTNLSVDLAESGDRAGGLEAIRRAVEIREGLAEGNFAAYGPDLARSLNNLSVALAESGDRAGGLEAIRRAVEIREGS
jgi:DNA polymerase III delta prime subunit